MRTQNFYPVLFFILFFTKPGKAQNVGINSDGSAPENGVMLDVKSPTAKATTAVVQTVFQLKSFDVNTDALKLRIGFKTDAAQANRYGFIDFPDFTTSTPTYLNLALQPSGGNVSIGTTTNPSFKLDIENAASQSVDGIMLRSFDNHYLLFGPSRGGGGNNPITQTGDQAIIFSDGTFPGGNGNLVIAPWSNVLSGIRITSTGNVGIGTSSPSFLLHAVSQGANDRNITNTRYQNSSASPAGLGTQYARGTLASPAAVQNGDIMGYLFYQGYNGSAFVPNATPAGVVSVATENFTGTGNGSNLEFYTVANGTTNGSLRMTVDHNGNVGIGTNPTYKFHVYNTDPAVVINSYSQFSPTLSANQASNLHSSWNEINTNSTFNFNCWLWGAVNRINILAGQSGAITGTVGSTNDLFYYGSGTIASAYGSQNVINNSSAINGVITDATGAYAQINNTGNGSITNGYGVYIGTIAATNKWSLYSTDATALSYFAGNVGIGTTAPSEKLEVCGNVKVVGNMNANGGSFASGVSCSSDIRFKTNIRPMKNALENVLLLRGVNYDWRVKEFPEKNFTAENQIGFIAQELEKIYPEVVFTDKDGYKSVDYSRLTPILVEAIKQQQKQMDDYEKRIKTLEEIIGNKAEK